MKPILGDGFVNSLNAFGNAFLVTIETILVNAPQLSNIPAVLLLIQGVYNFTNSRVLRYALRHEKPSFPQL